MAMGPKLNAVKGKIDRRAELVKFSENGLPSRAGVKYRDAVVACLKWNADGEKVPGVISEEEKTRRRAAQIDEFRIKVVATLRECQCGNA